MKLTVPSKISALLSNIRKWKINASFYNHWYEIYFIPTIKYNDWSATRGTVSVDGEYIETHYIIEHRLTAAFLTFKANAALKKETPV